MANESVIRGPLTILGTLPDGTGDSILTIDSTTKAIGSIAASALNFWKLDGTSTLTNDVTIVTPTEKVLEFRATASDSTQAQLTTYVEDTFAEHQLEVRSSQLNDTCGYVFRINGVDNFLSGIYGVLNSSQLKLDLSSGLGMVITDDIFSRGIVYAASYSANYTDRSLIDRGFANNNYWKIFGATTLTGNTTINTGAFSVLIGKGNPLTGLSTGSYVDLEGDELFLGYTTGTANNELHITSAGATYIQDPSGVGVAGIKYAADYSAGFTDRSLIDRGFANSSYWKTSGTTTISGTTNVSLSGSSSTVLIGNSIYGYLFTSKTGANQGTSEIGAVEQSSASSVRLTFDSGTPATSATVKFEDFRNTRSGIEYGADYSAGFSDRSLIDRGFANSNYWKVIGTTTLTGDITASRNSGTNTSTFEMQPTLVRYKVAATSPSIADVTISNSSQEHRVAFTSDLTNIVRFVEIQHITSGSVAVGFGTGIRFTNDVGAGQAFSGSIESIWSDVTGSSEDADLVFKVYEAGIQLEEKFRISPSIVTSVDATFIAKGPGNTGATDALRVIDSDSHVMFAVADDENIVIGSGGSYVTGPSGNIFICNTDVAPGAVATSGIWLYAQDSGDGNSTLALYTEQVPEATATFTQTHRLKVRINGTEYWLSLDAV